MCFFFVFIMFSLNKNNELLDIFLLSQPIINTNHSTGSIREIVMVFVQVKVTYNIY